MLSAVFYTINNRKIFQNQWLIFHIILDHYLNFWYQTETSHNIEPNAKYVIIFDFDYTDYYYIGLFTGPSNQSCELKIEARKTYYHKLSKLFFFNYKVLKKFVKSNEKVDLKIFPQPIT